LLQRRAPQALVVRAAVSAPAPGHETPPANSTAGRIVTVARTHAARFAPP
jgi:hypothetical protein